MLTIGQNWAKIANYPPQCSTKICTPGLHSTTISLIKILNNSGPITLPCGTPLAARRELEYTLLLHTTWVLLLKNSLVQLTTLL